MQTLAAANPLEHVIEHPLSAKWAFDLFGQKVYLSNHQLTMSVACLLLLVAFMYVGAKAKTNTVPRGLHNFFEAILSFLRTEVFRPALKENTDRFAPFLWTVFFFILFCNLLGMIPAYDIAKLATGGTVHLPHFWGTATGNILVTATLAILAFFTIHISGIWQQARIAMNPELDPHHGHGHDHDHGHGHAHAKKGEPAAMALVLSPFRYAWNFAPHPETGIKAMDLGLWAVLLVLEVAGALVKPFALCVRLFANMIAGHLILAALLSMIPFGAGLGLVLGVSVPVVLGCVALNMLELFVCFLQAYIFTFLTTLFIGSSVSPEH